MPGNQGQFNGDVAVIGGGPAGLVAAIALEAAGAATVLIAPEAKADTRTTALLSGSVTALDALGVWERCLPYAAPLERLRIVDDSGRLFRGPEVSFAASEIGRDAFGYNIENRHLLAVLEARTAEIAIKRRSLPARTIEPDRAGVTVRLDDGEVRVRLVVAADGRQSLGRKAAGIAMRRRDYPQTALTVNFGHSRPHEETSTEFHTATGPFTVVPLPGRRSSLVCVLDPATAAALFRLDDAGLAKEIERRSHSLLGKVTVESGRSLFPLSVETAQSFASARIALVGEAAHVVPPIGAQGLNLGLRDGACIAELVADALADGRDPGGADVLELYESSRRADVTVRTLAIDVLNRSLLSDLLPVQAARGLGLYLLEHVSPLRRAVMREGMAPRAAEPRLMRGEPLAPLPQASLT
jgi:2-octaprenyl-6-methoxyphenol hydroxylase